MNYFIFQAVPNRFDLRKELKEDTTISWIASRYSARMGDGDLVFYWLGGPTNIRGVYGWGNIVGAATGSGPPEVKVRCRKVLSKHIEVDDIRKQTQLLNMMILNMALGTNFQISASEAAALTNMMPASERPILGTS